MVNDDPVGGHDEFCRHCGHPLGGEDLFCGSCGEPVSTEHLTGSEAQRDPDAAPPDQPLPPPSTPQVAVPPPPQPGTATAPPGPPTGGAPPTGRAGAWAAFRRWPVAAQVALWVLLGLLLILPVVLLVNQTDEGGDAEPASEPVATTAPAVEDLSGTWEATQRIVARDASLVPDEVVAEVVIICDENGTCATASGDALFEPIGEGRYTVTGDYVFDCAEEETGELMAVLAYDVRRDGEAEVTVEEGERIVEVAATWVDAATANEAGVAAGCIRASTTSEVTLVRLSDEGPVDVPDPDAAQAIPGFGSDPRLGDLAEQCEAGDLEACDWLYDLSDDDSGYKEFGDSCGGRNQPSAYCGLIYKWYLRPIG